MSFTSKNMGAAVATALTYFTINEETTGDFLDLDGSDGSKCGVYSQGSHQLGYYPAVRAADGTTLMTFTDSRSGASEDFEMVARVGCSHDNKPFARIMRNVSTGIFNVVFQPLILAGSEDDYEVQVKNVGGVIQKRKVKVKDRDYNLYTTKTLTSWFLSQDDSAAASDVSCKKTAAKLVWVVRSLFDRQPVGLDGGVRSESDNEVLVKRGDYRMLMEWQYPTCVNVKPGGESTGGMMEFIDKVLQEKGANGVIFSGYSLGSGLATAASLIYAGRRPGFPIGLVSCCGEAATNVVGANVVARFPLTTLNVVVNGDDVSGVSGPWVQQHPTLGINFLGKSLGNTNKRIAMLPKYNTPKTQGQFYTIVIDSALGPTAQAVMRGVLQASAAAGSAIALGSPVALVAGVFGFVGGLTDRAAIAKNFRNLHLAAEDLVPLILFENLMNRIRGNDSDLAHQKPALAAFGVNLDANLDNPAFCEWYSNTSFAMKYGVCPLRFCRLVRDPNGTMRCVHRGIVMQIGLPIGGEEKTKKRPATESPPTSPRRKNPPVQISALRRLTGYDLAIVKAAEAAYIAAMNNFKVKNAVITDIVATLNKQRPSASRVKFLGSILVTRTDVAEAKRVVGDVVSMQEAVAFLAQYRAHEGQPLAFVLGGFTLPDTSHHATFIWMPRRRLIGFNPGTGCWGTELPAQITETVKEATGLEIEWDKLEGIASLTSLGTQTLKGTAKAAGPQDVMFTKWARGDGFCQTWSVFWLANYMSGCPASAWPKDYAPLYAGIRRFILWILRRFEVVYKFANDDFHNPPVGIQGYPDQDVYQVLAKGWHAIDPNVTPPTTGMHTFCDGAEDTD